MDWLRSKQRTREKEHAREGRGASPPAPVVRAAPGIAALFDGVKADGSHAVVDLGPAAEPHFRLYGQYARRIRFADLVPRVPYGSGWEAADRALPLDPRQPYDLVLAWNVLDRLTVEERPQLVERLDRITAPGARLYTLVEASGAHETRPCRFTLLDVGRVSQDFTGPAELAGRELLPAEVERLLEPFEVVHAYTLRSGMREYVAIKRREGSG
jgi:hypothetical protein